MKTKKIILNDVNIEDYLTKAQAIRTAANSNSELEDTTDVRIMKILLKIDNVIAKHINIKGR